VSSQVMNRNQNGATETSLVVVEDSLLAGIRAQKAKIAVLGMGHVGLPTALGLAEMGWQVLGGDSCAPLIAELRAGKMPFYEPGLADLFAKHVAGELLFRP
jgi:UDP-N-acetyl-D-mannosaminuronate dehydrogenase